MNSKTSIQTILIIIIFIISFLFYYEYFYKKSLEKKVDKQIELLEKEKSNLTGNTIKNIIYESKDKNGNTYKIESEYGEFSSENENIIFMTNVKALIKLEDGSIALLYSINARYNISNSNTNFSNQVTLEYLEHNVNADNLDISFVDSKLAAYNNLVYKNLDLNLIADKVEIDLISKDSKIFMLNDKKVKILKKTNGNY
jgi:hypothetical protein